MIAILGKKDQPTDAVQDFCEHLREALESRGAGMELFRVPWLEKGRRAALAELRARAAHWEGRWALLQYTALAWSRRGFPLLFRSVARLLRERDVRVAIVFHDPSPFPGTRLRDRVRARVQLGVLRESAATADRVISTVAAERLTWMNPSIRAKAVAIPVGSNLPSPREVSTGRAKGFPTVAVFGVTERSSSEACAVARVMQHAARELGLLRLVVFGRGAKEAGPKLEESLRGAPVELRVHAVLPPEEAAQRLAEADVQLNVRGEISTRRGSVIAGICTGLPVVGYRGAHTDFPITEAGVRFAPIGDEGALARELVNVLGDPRLAEELRQRSRDAARAHFSWEAIAGRYVAALGLPSGMPEEAVHSGGRPG